MSEAVHRFPRSHNAGPSGLKNKGRKATLKPKSVGSVIIECAALQYGQTGFFTCEDAIVSAVLELSYCCEMILSIRQPLCSVNGRPLTPYRANQFAHVGGGWGWR